MAIEGQTATLGIDSIWHQVRRIEWPTLAVIATTYSAFGLLTWFHDALPWWLILPLAGYCVCLQGSLQHEAVHGHPTPWRGVNEAFVFPSLWLWMPFRLYRRDHLAHHNNEILTDPLEDPESYYLRPEDWAALPAWRRTLLRAHNTLLCRLLFGPIFAIYGFYAGEVRRARSGKKVDTLAWGLHLAGVAVTLIWVMAICRIPLIEYVLLYAYPGVSLTLLRSFLEHQARPNAEERSVIVEAEAPIALMFLNNNLHLLHHTLPHLPWYRLPGVYKADKRAWQEKNQGYVMAGYREVFRRFFLRAKEPVAHPHLPLGA